MKKLLLLSLLAVSACSDPALQQELDTVRSALDAARATIAELEAAEETEASLVHIVFFKVKPEADLSAFIAEIKKLEAIEVVQELEVGPREDVGDARALSDYGVIMEISFADMAAYEQYQQHPIHLALKDNTMDFLAGPPATYDFIKN